MDPTCAFYCQSNEARGTELPDGGVGHGLGTAVLGAPVRAAQGMHTQGIWPSQGVLGTAWGHSGDQHRW